MNEFTKSLTDIGVHDCSSNDILAFAQEISIANQNEAVKISIDTLVDLIFPDPHKEAGAGAVFFSGGGSRTHERDVSVQPRGVHVAVNLVRQRICQVPGMDKPGGIGAFFDSMDPDGKYKSEERERCIAYMESTVVVVIVIFIGWFFF